MKRCYSCTDMKKCMHTSLSSQKGEDLKKEKPMRKSMEGRADEDRVIRGTASLADLKKSEALNKAEPVASKADQRKTEFKILTARPTETKIEKSSALEQIAVSPEPGQSLAKSRESEADTRALVKRIESLQKAIVKTGNKELLQKCLEAIDSLRKSEPEADICAYCDKEIAEDDDYKEVKGKPYAHRDCDQEHGPKGTGWSPTDKYD